MKKLLLVSTALVGALMTATPASAKDTFLNLGGYWRGYGVYADNDEAAGANASLRKFEFRRDAEIHFTGESTLDNGLTVGAHFEMKVANGSGAMEADEGYGYLSGGWGRINLGIEDGAVFLLQVAAPSADANIDGMRTNINAVVLRVNDTATIQDLATALANTNAFGNDNYGQADFRTSERLTYMTPKFNGFQAGVSYAPTTGPASNTLGMSNDQTGAGGGISGAFTSASYKDLWEASARWDGEFQGFGMALGGGYSDSTNQARYADGVISGWAGAGDDSGNYAIVDGLMSWNGGLSVANRGFSLGGAYKHSETQRRDEVVDGGALATGDITSKTWLVGAGYDNGPYHVGVSYLKTTLEADALGVAANNSNDVASRLRITQTTGGAGYTFAPGMSFRGSVAIGKSDTPDTTLDNSFTQVAAGLDVKF